MSLFTVIIPTYKRSVLLKRAIESALRQTYSDIKILVLDNASGDETEKIVKEFQEKDSRIEYICHQKNIGMLAQYQYGIDHVKTEYFSFLSDDDILLPAYCETSIKGFTEYPDCCFFASSTIIYSKEKGILSVPLDRWPYEGRYEPVVGAHTMIGKYPVPTTVAFCKRFLSHVFIDKNNPIAWDCDFLLQLASRFPIAISKKVTGIFFNHPESLTAGTSYKNVMDSILRIIERSALIQPEKTEQLQILLQKYLFHETKGYAKFLGGSGRFKEGFLIGKSLLLMNPANLASWLILFALFVLRLFPFLKPIILLTKKVRNYNRKNAFSNYYRYLNEIS